MKTKLQLLEEIQNEFDAAWHTPYVYITVGVYKKPKYKALDHYGEYFAGGNTIEDFRYSINSSLAR